MNYDPKKFDSIVKEREEGLNKKAWSVDEGDRYLSIIETDCYIGFREGIEGIFHRDLNQEGKEGADLGRGIRAWFDRIELKNPQTYMVALGYAIARKTTTKYDLSARSNPTLERDLIKEWCDGFDRRLFGKYDSLTEGEKKGYNYASGLLMALSRTRVKGYEDRDFLRGYDAGCAIVSSYQLKGR